MAQDKKKNTEKKNTAVKAAFERLYSIVAQLRGPNGCPWDREQSPYTIRENLLEESYECIHAIEENDSRNLKEELGDLFLIIVMLSYMNEQKDIFTVEEVLSGISEKLIRRHPHVFEHQEKKEIPEIIKTWDYIKEHIEGKKHTRTIFEGIGKVLPPLERAYQIQKKAAKAGFDWKAIGPVFEKLDEEIVEMKAAYDQKKQNEIEMEIGDILFTLVNISRHLKINPSLALERSNKKFIARFQKVEEKVRRMKKSLEEVPLETLDEFWDEAKKIEH